MSFLNFTIALPKTADGFAGRKCAARGCGKYYQIEAKDAPTKIFCPYCGEAGALQATHTREQVEYVKEVGTEKLMKFAHDKFGEMLENVCREAEKGFKQL